MKTKTKKATSVIITPKARRSSRSGSTSAANIGRPALEVIACMANCAGVPETGIRFTFDLRDNRTGRVHTRLRACKLEGEWHIDGVWPGELPEVEDVPVLSALQGKRSFVDGEEHEVSERHQVVSEELDRWSRNLFSLAEEESQLDEGLDDFKKCLADIETEYGVEFDGNGKRDEVAYDKYWKWPLRPS